jgi:hypothetical protein
MIIGPTRFDEDGVGDDELSIGGGEVADTDSTSGRREQSQVSPQHPAQDQRIQSTLRRQRHSIGWRYRLSEAIHPATLPSLLNFNINMHSKARATSEAVR